MLLALALLLAACAHGDALLDKDCGEPQQGTQCHETASGSGTKATKVQLDCNPFEAGIAFKSDDPASSVPAALQNHTDDPYFPIYHVRPADGWHTNDPNGPFFFRGVFHLFSQCRQMAAAMPIPPGGWCHYASRNLIKWRRLGFALQPDRWFDEISLDTGSATLVDGVPTMLIPSVGKVTDDSVNFTCPQFRVASLRGPCRVRLTFAVPQDLDDPWLRVWLKPAENNPLLDAPPSDIEAYWHDFSQAWQDEGSGRWWVFAGAGWRGRHKAPCPTCKAGAPVPLCSAPNGSFHKRGEWSCHPGDELWVATNLTAGRPSEVFDRASWDAAAFSCPELYGLPALPASQRIFEGLLDDGKDHYWSGAYDRTERRFDPTGFTPLQYNWVRPDMHLPPQLPSSLRYPFCLPAVLTQHTDCTQGSANAGKSFWHAESSRRLLWQWLDPAGIGGAGGCHVNTEAHDRAGPGGGVIPCPEAKHAWDGVMSVPQSVSWDPEAGRLVIVPVREMEQLHKERLLSTTVVLDQTKREAGLHTSAAVSMAHVDIAMQFNVSQSAGVVEAVQHACRVGVDLFGGAVQIALDLTGCAMTVNSTHRNVSAPLPPRQRAAGAHNLRILVDGEQFEIFGLGGRANVALRARPDYNESTALGTAFAHCGGTAVKVRVQMHSMGTAYEDDSDHDDSDEVHVSMKHDDTEELSLLRPRLTLERIIAFSPQARLRDPTTALFDPVSKSWHMWCSYKPLSATHIYATNASIRHFVLRATKLNARGAGVDGTWEDAGDALRASGVPGTFDSDAVFTPNVAVECKTASDSQDGDGSAMPACTWYLWHGGVSGNGPAKSNEERIGIASASSPFGPFVRHGSDPVFTAEDSTLQWCGKGGAARVDFVVPLILQGVRYLAVKGVCKNFTALPVFYSPVNQSSWLPPYKPSRELGYTDLESPMVSSLRTCAREGFEKPAFLLGPDHNLHFLGHNHGSCEAEGRNTYHHLYRPLSSGRRGVDVVDDDKHWRFGGNFTNEWPAHPFYEPVPVPLDGSGVMGDRPGTGVPRYMLDFGQAVPKLWHSNISLSRIDWISQRAQYK